MTRGPNAIEPIDPRLDALIDEPAAVSYPTILEIAVAALIEAARRPELGAKPTPSSTLQAAFAASFVGARRPTHVRGARFGTAAIFGAAAVVFLGGVAAAAGLGELPGPIQRVAHSVLGAPSPARDKHVNADPSDSASEKPSDRPSGIPSETDSRTTASSGSRADSATGTSVPGAQAAPGLCRAWTVQHGSVNPNSTLHLRLAQLAGNLSIADFCAQVLGTPAITPSSWPGPLPAPSNTHGTHATPIYALTVHPSPTPHSAA